MRSPVTTTAAPTTYDSAQAKLQAVVELRELWKYRNLVRNLVARDLKVRYKRSVLGVIWVSLNPLLTMGVQALVFYNLLGQTIHFYPVFLLSGALVFSLFSQSTVAGMSNLINNGSTLRRMYVPPSVFVASSIGSAIVNFVFAIVPLIIVALFARVPFSITWPYILVTSFQAALFASGVAFVISTLMVFFNDMYELYMVFITAYNFLTPIFYQVTILPKWLQAIEGYNPMYLYVSGAQNAITTGTLPDLRTQLLGWAFAVVSVTAGWLIFTRMEDRFAYHF